MGLRRQDAGRQRLIAKLREAAAERQRHPTHLVPNGQKCHATRMTDEHPKKAPATEDQPLGFRERVGYGVQTWSAGYAEIILDLGTQHTNRMGIVHGGVYMTILDAAMGHAATWAAEPSARKRCVTISMTTGFMRSADAGRLTAIGELIGVHDAIATCRGRVIDADGRLLMAAQASFRYFV